MLSAILLLIPTLATVALSTTAAVYGSARPNVVWIVIEDASPHIGCYSESAIQTPAISGLARDGIRFTQAL